MWARESATNEFDAKCSSIHRYQVRQLFQCLKRRMKNLSKNQKSRALFGNHACIDVLKAPNLIHTSHVRVFAHMLAVRTKKKHRNARKQEDIGSMTHIF